MYLKWCCNCTINGKFNRLILLYLRFATKEVIRIFLPKLKIEAAMETNCKRIPLQFEAEAKFVYDLFSYKLSVLRYSLLRFYD